MGILMAGNYANVFMDLFETSLLNNFYKINCRETRNIGTFYRWDIFYLDKRWGLVQKKIWVLPEIKCKKDYEGRSWNLKYHNLPKLTDFLDVCITLSQQTLCTTQWRISTANTKQPNWKGNDGYNLAFSSETLIPNTSRKISFTNWIWNLLQNSIPRVINNCIR